MLFIINDILRVENNTYKCENFLEIFIFESKTFCKGEMTICKGEGVIKIINSCHQKLLSLCKDKAVREFWSHVITFCDHILWYFEITWDRSLKSRGHVTIGHLTICPFLRFQKYYRFNFWPKSNTQVYNLGVSDQRVTWVFWPRMTPNVQL